MAQIRPYETQVEVSPYDQINPYHTHATASDFGNTGVSEAGADIQKLAATLYDSQQTQEVSDVRTKLAQARANWTVQMQQRIDQAPAGDTTFASKFIEDFQNSLSTIGDGVTTKAGQQAFQQGAGDLVAHFTQSAGLYQAASVGVKARQDHLTSLDANRNTLLTDPSQFSSVLQSQEQALQDPNGPYAKMPADAREQLVNQTRKQLGLSAVEGMIRQSPNMAKTQLASGQWDNVLGPDNKFTLEREADVAIKANAMDQERLAAQQERLKRQAAERDGNNIVAALAKDPTDPGVKDMILNSNLTWEKKVEALALSGNALKPQADKDTNRYGDGFYDALQSVTAPRGAPGSIDDPTALWRRVGPDGDLTVAGVQKLNEIWAGRKTPAGEAETQMQAAALAAVKANLTYEMPGLPGKDPKGSQANAMFLQHFLPAYEAAKNDGQQPTDLLNMDDPKSLISRTMAQFQRTPQQMMQDRMDEYKSLGSGAAPAAPKPPTPNAPAPVPPEDAAKIKALGLSTEGSTTAAGIYTQFRAGKITREQASAQIEALMKREGIPLE